MANVVGEEDEWLYGENVNEDQVKIDPDAANKLLEDENEEETSKSSKRKSDAEEDAAGETAEDAADAGTDSKNDGEPNDDVNDYCLMSSLKCKSIARAPLTLQFVF